MGASLLLLVAAVGFVAIPGADVVTYVRVNQIGYLPDDSKVAIAFSESRIRGRFEVLDEATGARVHRGTLQRSTAPGWGRFDYYYELDFSPVRTSGRYTIRLENGSAESVAFTIGDDAYGHYQEDLLEFMRQQRCGYNPTLDMVCHQKDGRSFYGAMPDSSFVDVSGGWHDAGDQLKYLMTSSNATARLLLAYRLAPEKFGDTHDNLGRPRENGLADVLDEARWGLDWLFKIHPAPDQLIHQVADDRDHRGWKWPNEDISDYGWGQNSYRAAYFATGEPQGLREHKSRATGVANLAGRVAAAMAMAADLWTNDLDDPVFAARALRTARSAYALGKAKEGFQQGNSYGAPYRYTEDTWADDMQWGGAELFRVTGEEHYLEDAKHYARMINTTSWMGRDTTDHYQFYPFMNVGHFALYDLVDEAFQDTLAGYYRDGIEKSIAMSERNPYRVGFPFIWCSNSLAVNLITQIILYEKMTGDTRYNDFMVAQRDWMFGRNPWGTSMFTGIPRHGEFPEHVHTSVYAMTGRMIPGGLIDGPAYRTIYNAQLGLQLTREDKFAHLQNNFVVYHDDIGDYLTNEPIMDGTADAVYMMAFFGRPASQGIPAP
jgi:endoglucanase